MTQSLRPVRCQFHGPGAAIALTYPPSILDRSHFLGCDLNDASLVSSERHPNAMMFDIITIFLVGILLLFAVYTAIQFRGKFPKRTIEDVTPFLRPAFSSLGLTFM